MIKLVELLNEVIKKVGDKYVIYSKKGGKRLGTHPSKAKAKKQLAAIEISKKKAQMSEDIGDIIELELSEFESALKAIFAKNYPDSNLYFLQEERMYVSTDEEEPDAASMWGEGSDEEYYLAFNVLIEDTEEDRELTVLIDNASRGNYPGITTEFLKAIFEIAKRNHGSRLEPITKSTLLITRNSNQEKWEQIASKLGVEYESQ